MYTIATVPNDVFMYGLYDGDGRLAGKFLTLGEAERACAAMNFVEKATARFPGLSDEDGGGVSGADLIDLWNAHFVFEEEVVVRYREVK